MTKIRNKTMPDLTSTVFVVDDDPSVREALSLLLKSAGYNVKTFDSATEFLESGCVTQGSVCLVLDVRMPGLSGLDLQRELASRNYAIPVIFITGHGNVPMSVQAMKKGAVDFLPKPFDDNELLNAVKEAFARDSEVRLNLDKQKHIMQRLDSLTTREHEILRYLITGILYKQIANELNISEWTVKAHRKQIFHKMAVHSLAELVRLTETAGVKPADIAR
ncbi:response regulator transcription factor [bacterium]|nr:response regulator transcription factor [bacterium]